MTPDPSAPSPEDLKRYDELLSAVQDGRAKGEDTTAAEAELKDFQRKTGISDEAPPDFFDPDDHPNHPDRAGAD